MYMYVCDIKCVDVRGQLTGVRSFHRVGPGRHAQDLRLEVKCLYLLRQLLINEAQIKSNFIYQRRDIETIIYF